jgi:hypothetical protein
LGFSGKWRFDGKGNAVILLCSSCKNYRFELMIRDKEVEMKKSKGFTLIELLPKNLTHKAAGIPRKTHGPIKAQQLAVTA